MKNKIISTAILWTIFILAFVEPRTAFASIEDEDSSTSYSNYESIIQDLTSSRVQSDSREAVDPMELIRFHASIGWISSQVALNLPIGWPQTTTLAGVETRFGIDLFSPYWIAEGAVRTFNPEMIDSHQVRLKEFDLLVIHHNLFARPLEFVIGAGLTARYLEFAAPPGSDIKNTNATPASIFTTGISARITKMMSLDGIFSYRKALISETIDEGSLDGSVRLSGHF